MTIDAPVATHRYQKVYQNSDGYYWSEGGPFVTLSEALRDIDNNPCVDFCRIAAEDFATGGRL